MSSVKEFIEVLMELEEDGKTLLEFKRMAGSMSFRVIKDTIPPEKFVELEEE